MLPDSVTERSKRWLLALAVFIGACATVDGTDPYAMWGIVEHPQGLFSFRYLEGVWRTAADSTPERPVLVVGKSLEFPDKPSAAGPSVFEFEERYRLRAGVLENNGKAPAAAAAAEEYWLGQGFAVDEVAPLRSAGGADGWVLYAELHSKKPIFIAQVFHETGKSVVALEVWGHRSVRTPDMRLLLRGFEPASEDE